MLPPSSLDTLAVAGTAVRTPMTSATTTVTLVRMVLHVDTSGYPPRAAVCDQCDGSYS